MPRLKDSTVDAVKQAADLVAIVEDRTSLRKQSGGRMTGRCPFHEERTPSFSVNPVKGLYYCFGCGASGDAITFVRETQGLDFTGAIEWLADRFNITPEYEEAGPGDGARRRRRERLYELLDDAATFYERYLWESQAGSFARDYLAGRGLGEEICREFRLGLALGGNTLCRKAAEKGFTAEELRAAGLARQRGGDYFQRRLVFPLTDVRGRVVGFQARRLHEDDPLRAKYVNTPESELFHKGSLLYGLDKARAAISRGDRACVVEGNTDVIALRQAGFDPVVASMGTALTEQQLRELARLSKRLWLAFDGDAAGESATLRGMELAVAQGFDVRVVALPPGIDPADAPEGFEAQLRGARPYVVHRTQLEATRADDRPAGARAVAAFLDTQPASLEKDEAWRWANDYFGTTLQLRASAGGTASAAAGISPRVLAVGDKLERNALAGVVAFPELRPLLEKVKPEHFRDETHRRLRAHIVHGEPLDREGTALLAELDARAADEAIDANVGTELLLKLGERALQEDLQHADLGRTRQIQEQILALREAQADVRRRASLPD
jgi:DNA primase catalytic core